MWSGYYYFHFTDKELREFKNLCQVLYLVHGKVSI